MLAMATIVFHDALVSQAILDQITDHVMQVPVGKRSGQHSMAQGAINGLLVKSAQNGHRVVRLKGGDPAVFGRMTEEVDALEAKGIRVRVCPGITAASAAAASGVFSLTRRGSTRALTFITAQGCGSGQNDIDWSALAGEQTLAIYMGRAAAPHIAEQLIVNGLLPGTPILIAVNVSSPRERLIRGRLDSLAALMATVGDMDPALLLVGDVTRAQAESAGSNGEWLSLPWQVPLDRRVRRRA